MPNENIINRLERLFSDAAYLNPEPEPINLPPSNGRHHSAADSQAAPGGVYSDQAAALMQAILLRLGEEGQPENLLSSVLDLIRDQFGLLFVRILTLDFSEMNLRTAACSTELRRESGVFPVNAGSVFSRVVRKAEPVLIEDVEKGCNDGTFPASPGAHAALILPMIYQSRVKGVLILESGEVNGIDPDALAALCEFSAEFTDACMDFHLLREPETQGLRSESIEPLPEKANWYGFLDGIHHPQRIGFTFDGKMVRPLKVSRNLKQQGTAALSAPLQMGGEQVGMLQISPQAGRAWTSDQANLVQLIAQRLALQVDNLRLLDQSQQYRQEAETALKRLSLKSWEDYYKQKGPEALAFFYDQEQVQPLKPANRKAPEGEAVDAFALKVQGKPIGRVLVKRGPSAEPSPQWVEAIMDRLSAHIDALRLNEQREQALAESELLYSISSKLNGAVTLVEVLDAVSQPALAAGADHTQLFIVAKDAHEDPASVELVAVGGNKGVLGRMGVGSRFSMIDLLPYRSLIADPRKLLASTNIAQDPGLDENTRSAFKEQQIAAVAIVPLLVGPDWIGSVVYQWKTSHTFSAVEKRLYQSLSGQAAVVINNLMLLEQTRKRAKELETVARLSMAASSQLKANQLLQTVVDLTRINFNLYHVQVYLLDEKGDALVIAAGSGETGRRMIEEGRRIQLPWNNLPAVSAAKRRESVWIRDVLLEEEYVSHPLLPDVRSELCVPMIAGQNLLGVFDVLSDEPNHFLAGDMRIFSTLAAQTSVALQNARLYEDKLAAVARLQEIDRLKSNFLANMSHELRTPMNSVLGFADVMLLGMDGQLSTQMQEDIQLIRKNGKHLLNLINDVLDMAKIEAGRLQVNIEDVVLKEVVDEALDIVNPLAREKSLELKTDLSSVETLEVRVDRIRLQQVLINLLGNAIKFTETGSVQVSAYCQDSKVQIIIEDTGIGIPPDKLEMIFESFSQVDTSSSRRAGGTGLGLSISRSLVELLNGKLWAESAGIPGKGSRFIVEFPCQSELPEA